MPFLGPLALPLAKAGIGFGASLLGGKLSGAGKANAAEKGVLDNQTALMKQGADTSAKLQPIGTDMLGLAGKSFNPVVDYWSKLLSGDRGQATSMLAPQLNRISEGYGAQTQAAGSLMPRGGGRASLMQSLPYQQQRDQSTLLQNARPQAASGLLEAGQTAANTGNSIIANSIQALYGSTSAGRTVLDWNQQKRATDRSSGKEFGGLIYDLLQQIGPGMKGKAGAGGGGGRSSGMMPDNPVW